MFGKLFNRAPLWQHEDPAQRLLGLADLSQDAPEIVQLLDDSAPQVRDAALGKISQIQLLIQRAASAPRTETERTRLLELAAAADDLTRDQALATFGDESQMIAIASTASTAALRLAAAQRVHTIDGLKLLADTARNKDHGVAKYAKERAEAMASEAGRSAQAGACCDALEALVNADGAILSKVVELDRSYAALQPNAPEAARFASARAALAARFEREQDLQRTRGQWTKDFEAFKQREQTAEMSAATLTQARADYADLEARAAEMPELLGRLHHSGAKNAIEFLDRALVAQASADALLHDFAPQVTDRARLVEFEDRWNLIPVEGRDPQRQQQFDDLLSGHRRQFNVVNAADAQTQQEARQKLHALLAQAEGLLTEGEVQKAALLRDEMKPLRAIAGELPKPTNQRLGRLSQQLGDLLRWQAFGNATQREEMCLQAERVPQLGLGVAELAKNVQALRDQWKALDQSQAPAPKTLWERFNAACEIAYAPAAEHFTKLATERKEAQTRRETAIKEAADYAALALTPVPDVPDWSPDWKSIGLWLHKKDSEWRTLGHVDRRKIDQIEGKWKDATAPLRAGVRGAQSGESAERDKLISGVKALIGVDGKLAGGAVAHVKAAQAQWQARAKATPLPRKLEQTLWELFRNACNAVFAALDSEKTERNATFSAAISKKQALIEQFEALARGSDEKAIRAAINEAPRQWVSAGDAGRESERKLADRFDRSLRGLRDALRGNERNKSQRQLDALLQVARACGIWDESVANTSIPAAQIWEANWASIEHLPPAWRQKLQARKDAAERAISNGAAASASFVERAASASKMRETAIADLELSLGIDSPSMTSEQRMKRQVAKLAERMKSGGVAAATPMTEQLVAICAHNAQMSETDYARLNAIIAASGRAARSS